MIGSSKRLKGFLLAILGGLVLLFLLVLAETRLPFFQKFLPIKENKLLIFLLNVNILLILLILFLTTRTIVKTYLERRRGILGSRLKTKLTLSLVFLSLVPALTLFILTSGFFKESMDRWFDEKIEGAVEAAFEVSNLYYEELFQRCERILDSISKEVETAPPGAVDVEDFIKRAVKASGVELILYRPSIEGKPPLISGTLPSKTARVIVERVKFSGQTSGRWVIPVNKGELLLVGKRAGEDGMLLVGTLIELPGTERIKEIASLYGHFKEARPFRKILKYGFLLPLTLITLLVLFFSVWMGIKMADAITVPIEKVREGVSIIAKGKFDIDLEDKGEDEIGMLVTAFNQMAKELKRTKEEIEEKRRHLELILENVTTGIISTEKNGRVLLLNRAAQEILGVEDGIEGKRLQDILGQEVRRQIKGLLRQALKEGSITRELRMTSRRGVISLRSSLTALKDEDGKVKGFLITFDDVTQVLKAERLSSWRRVARRLTHEIKNPLTPIALSAERIRRKVLPLLSGEAGSILEETTSTILRSLDDIKGIVNDLTRLTHISQTKNPDDISGIIEESLSLYKGLYPNVTFFFEKEEIPPFMMDREGMKRVFVNLITNSLKAIGDGDGEIRVKASLDTQRSICVIEVSDTGKGVPDEEKARIFDPYYTKDKDGLGLGLAIVQSIVLEHHGSIRVEDNLPRGARFVIELPILRG
jgi:two-component system nitrogen regulation sensor histidine kinase NtrY